MTIDIDRGILATAAVDVMTDAEVEGLKRRRERVAAVPGFFGDLNSNDGRLRLIDFVLKDRQAVRDDVFLLEALGIVLGDALTIQMAMNWYMLETSVGRLPCVGAPGLPVKIPVLKVLGDAIMGDQPIRAREMLDDLCRMVIEWKADIQASSQA